MSWVAVAVVGAGGLVAGSSLYGASTAAGATREGAQIAGDAAMQGMGLQREMFLQSMRTLQPFVNLGLGAGSTLAATTVSPQEQLRQREIQRAQLEAGISVPFTDADIPLLSGKNASERRAAMASEMYSTRNREIAEAKRKLEAFDKETGIIKSQLDARKTEGIQASPLYEFQRDLGERNIKRNLAATGRQDTGFGMETLSNFYRALGAEETDRQTGRLMNLTTIGANAGAQQATNAMQTGNTQAGLIQQAGQFYGTGVSQAGQIEGAGIQGIGKTATQVGLLALLAGKAGLFGNGGGQTISGVQDQAYMDALKTAQKTGEWTTYFKAPGY